MAKQTAESPDGTRASRARAFDGAAAPHVRVAQRVVAVHQDHQAAETTVGKPQDAGSPVERITVVGRNLPAGQRRTGRLSTTEVTGRGALAGLITGVVVAALLELSGLVTPSGTSVWLIIAAAVLGAVLGAVIGLLGYVFTRGRRTVATHCAMRAGHDDVDVDADLADRAVRLPHGPKR